MRSERIATDKMGKLFARSIGAGPAEPDGISDIMFNKIIPLTGITMPSMKCVLLSLMLLFMVTCEKLIFIPPHEKFL